MMERLASVSGCPLTSLCPLLNISQCEVTEHQAEFSVGLYNPLTSEATRPVSGDLNTTGETDSNTGRGLLVFNWATRTTGSRLKWKSSSGTA